jgi:hypothetical protein
MNGGAVLLHGRHKKIVHYKLQISLIKNDKN